MCCEVIVLMLYAGLLSVWQPAECIPAEFVLPPVCLFILMVCHPLWHGSSPFWRATLPGMLIPLWFVRSQFSPIPLRAWERLVPLWSVWYPVVVCLFLASPSPLCDSPVPGLSGIPCDLVVFRRPRFLCGFPVISDQPPGVVPLVAADSCLLSL